MSSGLGIASRQSKTVQYDDTEMKLDFSVPKLELSHHGERGGDGAFSAERSRPSTTYIEISSDEASSHEEQFLNKSEARLKETKLQNRIPIQENGTWKGRLRRRSARKPFQNEDNEVLLDQLLSKISQIEEHRSTQLREEFGWTEDHFVLGPVDEDVFVATNPLGHGSLGVVEEVCRIGGDFPTLVRKRVNLPLSKKHAAAYLEIVQKEARILKSLRHRHIVKLIGSYEDMKQFRRHSYCLLMSPVGENDLESLLTIVGESDQASEFSVHWRKHIRSWMGCLASALHYMHAKGIRHQDVKPSNIIHKGDRVFFTDFSSSSSFKVGHTTSTESPARSTPMYGAPEVTSDRGKHGRATDVFSLGCVFSDMLSVIEGRTLSDFRDYLRNDGDAVAPGPKIGPRALSYSERVPAITSWFAASHHFNTVVSRMLQPDRKTRPTADEVVQSLIFHRCCDRDCPCLRYWTLQFRARGFEAE